MGINLSKYYSKFKCNFCHKTFSLTENSPYYFQIHGLGKHDQKKMCQNCLITKVNKL